MPTPSYGSAGRTFEQRENAIADASGPQAEVLGVVNQDRVQELANRPLPPWEVEQGFNANDARAFVDVPNDWTLRWINPRLLDSEGWRYWQKVSPSDSRVKVKVDSMTQVDNTIRRGGVTGDILAWMPTYWVESMRQKLAQAAKDLIGTTEAKREQLNEQFKRGTFGPYVQGEAKHTISEVNQQTFGTVAR